MTVTFVKGTESFGQRAARRFRGLGRGTRLALYGLGALLLAWLLWHFLSPLFATPKKPPPPPPVKVARAMRKTVDVMQKTIGTVVSPAMVQVTAQVTGKLLAANFREGDIVHKGDVLFQIDPAPFQAALEEAQGQAARDAATLANDQVDLKRYQQLAQQNAISNQQMVTQAAKVKSDQGVMVTDQANIHTAQINLGYTRIVSPINGKTGPIFIQPGNVVTAQQASAQPLVTITQIQPIKVSFMLPQSGLAQIQNQYAQGKLTVTVPIAGAAGGAEKSVVDFVSNVVSGASGTIELRADFPNDDMRLVPGQTATVSVAVNQLPNALVVPRDAVNLGPDSSFVLVVGEDGKAYSKTVKVLNDNGVNDAIAGDVSPGDLVVTDGQLRVTPGQPVQVTKGKDSPKPAAPAP